MAIAVFGIVFGILGIFTIGMVFVPLAALCAVVGLLAGIAKGRFSIAFLSVVAGVLAMAGWVFSPTLWALTAAVVAPH